MTEAPRAFLFVTPHSGAPDRDLEPTSEETYAGCARMIADLHGGRLQPQRWGAKASNLALIATAGVPVPPGLCLWPQVVGAEARGVALRAWLSESRASSLIVRSSTAEEDGGDASGAGRSLSVPSVPPDAESVDAAISTVSTAAAAAGLDLQSVVIQEEVMPSVSGVACYMRHRRSRRSALRRHERRPSKHTRSRRPRPCRDRRSRFPQRDRATGTPVHGRIVRRSSRL